MTKQSTSIVWRGVQIEVRCEEDWLSTGLTHIEVEAKPRTKLPITETGYRSRFLDPSEFEGFADAAAFVTAWLDHDAQGWSGQLSLF